MCSSMYYIEQNLEGVYREWLVLVLKQGLEGVYREWLVWGVKQGLEVVYCELHHSYVISIFYDKINTFFSVVDLQFQKTSIHQVALLYKIMAISWQKCCILTKIKE